MYLKKWISPRKEKFIQFTSTWPSCTNYKLTWIFIFFTQSIIAEIWTFSYPPLYILLHVWRKTQNLTLQIKFLYGSQRFLQQETSKQEIFRLRSENKSLLRTLDSIKAQSKVIACCFPFLLYFWFHEWIIVRKSPSCGSNLLIWKQKKGAAKRSLTRN